MTYLKPGFKLKAAGLFIWLCLSFVSVSAQNCVQYDDYLHEEQRIPISRASYNMKWHGDHLFSVELDSTFTIYSAAAGSEVTELVAVSLPGIGRAVVILDDLAIVAVDAVGLFLFDISVPSNPIHLNTFEQAGGSYYAEAVGNMVFHASGSNHMIITDFSDPLNPVDLSSYYTGSHIYKIRIFDNIAYAILNHQGYHLLDISDPSAPEFLSVITVPEYAYDVAVSGQIAYLGGWENTTQVDMLVYDVSDPINPVQVNTIGSHNSVRNYKIIDGGYLLSTGVFGGFQIFDINDAQYPELIGWQDFLSSGYGLAVDGNRVFTSYSGQLVVYDITNPNSVPNHVWSRLDADERDLAIEGNVGLLACGEAGLSIIDVTDPVNPVELGSLDLPGVAVSVAWWNNHAVLTCESAGLFVVDVSDPASPQLVGSLGVPGSLRDVVIRGDYAFVAALYQDLKVVDLSDPAAMEVVGSAMISGAYAYRIESHGDQVYLSCWEDGLVIIDALDPTDPQISTVVDDLGDVRSIGFDDNTAVVTTWDVGVQILDVSDPAFPVLTDHYANEDGIGVTVFDGMAYMNTQPSGYYVLDVSDPWNVEYVGGRRCEGYFRGFVEKDGWLMRTYRNHGLGMVPVQCTLGGPPVSLVGEMSVSKGMLKGVFPNPFNPRCVIPVELDEEAELRLEVFDLAGRRVRVLAAGVFGVGRHEFWFDGKGEGGGVLGSGVFFVRLEVAGVVEVQRMVLWK